MLDRAEKVEHVTAKGGPSLAGLLAEPGIAEQRLDLLPCYG
jgi:hypothetical protein